MRAMHARLSAGIKDGSITQEMAMDVASPLRTLKGLFPNSPLAKHTPLDIFLAAPLPNRQRPLVFRDLGSIESDWVATEFVLNYFDTSPPSPAVSLFFPLKSRYILMGTCLSVENCRTCEHKIIFQVAPGCACVNLIYLKSEWAFISGILIRIFLFRPAIYPNANGNAKSGNTNVAPYRLKLCNVGLQTITELTRRITLHHLTFASP